MLNLIPPSSLISWASPCCSTSFGKERPLTSCHDSSACVCILNNVLSVHNNVCLITGSYDEVLYQSAQDLQPKHLVNFLLKLRWGTACVLWTYSVYSRIMPDSVHVLSNFFQPPDLLSTQRVTSEGKLTGSCTGSKSVFSSLNTRCCDILLSIETKHSPWQRIKHFHSGVWRGLGKCCGRNLTCNNIPHSISSKLSYSFLECYDFEGNI